MQDELREWYLERVGSSPEVNDQMLERIRADLESARFAETVPPMSAMVVDNGGNLWVEQFRWFVSYERAPVAQPTSWSVFDPTGVWLGDVEVPSGFILHEVTSDLVLGFEIDEMDVREIYAYPLHRE